MREKMGAELAAARNASSPCVRDHIAGAADRPLLCQTLGLGGEGGGGEGGRGGGLSEGEAVAALQRELEALRAREMPVLNEALAALRTKHKEYRGEIERLNKEVPAPVSVLRWPSPALARALSDPLCMRAARGGA